MTATNSFTVTVREVNIAPTLPIIPAQTVNELALLTVTNTATNANIHSTISGYTLVSPPAGASISTNGIITWTPSPTQSPSTNTFTTVVTNANPYDLVNPHLTATNSFKVVVVLIHPQIVLTSAVLVAESCLPTNGVIDPGETVTVLLALQNVGAANTTNLVVTLLATNGVTGPSGPQTYGALVAGGAAVSQPFTFAAGGSCGSNLNAVLQLQDGASELRHGDQLFHPRPGYGPDSELRLGHGTGFAVRLDHHEQRRSIRLGHHHRPGGHFPLIPRTPPMRTTSASMRWYRPRSSCPQARPN